MRWWQWVLDSTGGVVLLVLLYLFALIVRRRLIARHGGTFELSHRIRTRDAGGPGEAGVGGWMLGIGRYSGETLEWFRVFSLAPRPRRSWRRIDLSYDGSRAPVGTEGTSLYPDHLVITCRTPRDEVDLAMSGASLTGFQAWLEARPPGTDWGR